MIFVFAVLFTLAYAQCDCSTRPPPSCDNGTVSGVIFTVTCYLPYVQDQSVVLLGSSSFNGSPSPFTEASVTPNGTCRSNIDVRLQSTFSSFVPDDANCRYIATLQVTPANVAHFVTLSDPQSWLFTNGSVAASISVDSSYNVITFPIAIGYGELIGANSLYRYTNQLYSYYFRLPRVNTAEATRYALKLFKLSDNEREANLAFSAILLGGLANVHELINGSITFDGAPLTCYVSDIALSIIDCGPFIDSGALPVQITGTLTASAKCNNDVNCIPRTFTLNVDFLAGDKKSTLDGEWSALHGLIWYRPIPIENSTAIIVNDVFEASDTIVLSWEFDPGTVTTIESLTLNALGIVGVGSGAVETPFQFIIDVTTPLPGTIIRNQLDKQADETAFYQTFGIPPSYDLINVAIQFDTVFDPTFRGRVDFDTIFDVQLQAGLRRQENSGRSLVLIQKQGHAGGRYSVDENGFVIIEDGAPTIFTGLVITVLVCILML